MVETAVVKEIKDQIAIVEVQKSASCGSCGACSAGKGGNMLGTAVNKVGAQKGDLVLLELNDSVLKAASIVYIVPVMMLFAGYYAGAVFLNGGESQGILGAILALAVSFVFVVIYDRRAKSSGQYQLMIKKIKQRG